MTVASDHQQPDSKHRRAHQQHTRTNRDRDRRARQRVGAPAIEACEGRSPHGFIGQEAEVAAGIARFVLGGKY